MKATEIHPGFRLGLFAFLRRRNGLQGNHIPGNLPAWSCEKTGWTAMQLSPYASFFLAKVVRMRAYSQAERILGLGC